MASSHNYKLPLLVISLMVAAAAMAAAPKADAQLLGPISSLLSLLRIDGILFCSLTGSATGAATPVFPNATVQLQCGGTVISTSITNASGAFSFLLDPVQFLLSTLVGGCRLTVATPLSTCNASLPSIGTLTSALQSLGSTIAGLLNITQLVPVGFRLIN